MTSKDKVLSVYPDAWVTPKSAQSGPFGGEFWIWHDERPVPADYRPLGAGRTQPEAWKHAAANLPVPSTAPPAAVPDSKDQRIANLESELQIARDLIQQKNERLMELERQLAAAELGSSMQHERYGSY